MHFITNCRSTLSVYRCFVFVFFFTVIKDNIVITVIIVITFYNNKKRDEFVHVCLSEGKKTNINLKL